jgi:phosphoserine phosphatase RsbU/P
MAVLTFTRSDAEGLQRIELNRGTTSIGRSPTQDVVLTETCVSRQHALIIRDGDGYAVVDQNSSHGTFLNSVRVTRAALRAGDVLQLGSLAGTRLYIQAGEDGKATSRFSQPTAIDLLSSLSELRVPREEVLPAAHEMEKLNWLLRAARQLNAGAAIDEILKVFLHLALQLTELERGFVFLREGEQMRLAQGLNADGGSVEEDSTLSRRAMHQAIESKSKFSVSDTRADQNAAGWSSVIINSIRSIYCIPLRQRGTAGEPSQLLGLLYLDSQIGPGKLTEVDDQLLETIAAEAAALMHNTLLAEAEYRARQEREELALAANIHSGLMAIALPTLPYATLQAKTIPCLAIGGDFYDAVVLEDCVCVVIADVSGKGTSAAIVAATLQGIIHSQLLAGQDLAKIASLVNQFLCTRNVGKYATMVMLKLFSDGRVEYINCGHIPPLCIVSTSVRRLEESTMVVGLIPVANYVSARYLLTPGEKILLVTDGITEAEDRDGNQFGDTELNDIAGYNDVHSLLDRVAKFHAPHPPQDDCTLMEILYVGSARPSA